MSFRNNSWTILFGNNGLDFNTATFRRRRRNLLFLYQFITLTFFPLISVFREIFTKLFNESIVLLIANSRVGIRILNHKSLAAQEINYRVDSYI